MKHDRMWLGDIGLRSVSYMPGSSNGWEAQFWFCDGKNTMILDEYSARKLSEFILTKLVEQKVEKK